MIVFISKNILYALYNAIGPFCCVTDYYSTAMYVGCTALV